MLQMLSQLYKDAQNAKCDADIKAAAQRLANSLVDSGGQIVAGLAGVFGSVKGGGTTRIASGLNELINFAEKSLGGSTAAASTVALVLEEGGTVSSTAVLKPGLGGTATQAETGVEWGKGNIRQGNPFETWVQRLLGFGTEQTPPSYPVVDHFNPGTGLATSTKTLDTELPSYRNSTTSVYNKLKGYIDQLEGFPPGARKTYDGYTINASDIKSKQIQLGVPDTTNAAQWGQIIKAIQYAKGLGIDVIVTVITP
jgi:hypothetical protein